MVEALHRTEAGETPTIEDYTRVVEQRSRGNEFARGSRERQISGERVP